MALSVAAEPVPLTVDGDGTARVGGTRIPLDTVVRAFKRGDPAEKIAGSYPTLTLADVYAVIAYYLRHESDVEVYLRWRQQRRDEVYELIESRSDRRGIRERLRARRNEQADPAE